MAERGRRVVSRRACWEALAAGGRKRRNQNRRDAELVMRLAVVLLWITLARAEDPAALSVQAQKSAQQRRIAEAERLCKRAIEIARDYFPALVHLGLIYSV